MDSKVEWIGFVRNQSECVLVELGSTPWAFLDRDWRGIGAIISFESHRLGVRAVLVPWTVVATLTHAIGRRRLSDPQTDFKRPFAKLGLVLLPLKLEGAHQR